MSEATTTTPSQGEIAEKIRLAKEKSAKRRAEVAAKAAELKNAALPLANTRYFHLRRTCEHWNLMPRGGATVAMRKADDGYEFAIVICSLDDTYCKRAGRAAVNKRLSDGIIDLKLGLLVGNKTMRTAMGRRLLQATVQGLAEKLGCFALLNRWGARGVDFAQDLLRS